MFELAKWIWKSKIFEKNSYGWFFKHVEINDEIVDAVIHISAHNHFKLLINKEIVSGLVSPASSRVNKDKLYLRYDIKPYLRIGLNEIEVIVLYLGGYGQNYENGVPGFILEGWIDTPSQKLKLISDASWKFYDQIPYKDGLAFQQNRRITPIEYYDDTIELDKDRIQEVIVLKSFGTYHKQQIPEGQILDEIKPKLIGKQDQVMVYDLGRIISGFVKIDALSAKDLELTIRYSEDLVDKRVKHHVANEHSDTYFDHVKLKANKRFDHQADFTYKAFRYFEVTGNLDVLKEFNVIGMQAGTDANLLGKLDIKDDPYINKLFDMFYHTQRNNILGQLVDCPHREQAQYLGDSLLQSLAISYNIVESKSILSKVLDDFMYAQYDDGTFPFVSPGSTHSDEFSLKIPEYDLYFIELVYQRYQLDLDEQVIYKYKGTMIKLIDHYLSKLDDQFHVIKKNSEWHISDWPYPTVDEQGSYLTYENMLFYRVLNLYIKMFEELEDMTYFKSFLSKLKISIISLFKHEGLFIDSEQSKQKHQGIQAFALLNGFFETDEVESVLDYISSLEFSSSIILGRYVVEALFIHKRYQEAYTYLFEYDKGWGHIIREGSPTMWEGFDDIESHSHAWGLYPVYFIQKYILGIKTIENDLSQVRIEPFFYKHVKEMSGSIIINEEILKVSLRIDDQYLWVNLTIPIGITVNLTYKNIVKVFKETGSFVFVLRGL